MRTLWSLVVPVLAVAASAGSPAGSAQAHRVIDDVAPAVRGPMSPARGLDTSRLDIRGVVVDSEGTPIQGATVRVLLGSQPVSPGDPPSVTTDATGAFEILGLARWPRAVEATHADFAPAFVGISAVTGPPPVRLQMSAGGRIEGVALQKHGTPLAGLRVEVQSTGDGRTPVRTLVTTTREDGSFALDHVPTGSLSQVSLRSPRGGYLMEAERTPARRHSRGQGHHG